MNGYVEKGGEKFLWIGKRSRTKSTYPGMLDHLVAGGLVCNNLSIYFVSLQNDESYVNFNVLFRYFHYYVCKTCAACPS